MQRLFPCLIAVELCLATVSKWNRTSSSSIVHLIQPNPEHSGTVVCNVATKKYGFHCSTVVAVFVYLQSVLTRLAAV